MAKTRTNHKSFSIKSPVENIRRQTNRLMRFGPLRSGNGDGITQQVWTLRELLAQ